MIQAREPQNTYGNVDSSTHSQNGWVYNVIAHATALCVNAVIGRTHTNDMCLYKNVVA